jgi:hypothetical protein
MPKFQSKPKTITAVQLVEGQPLPPNVHQKFDENGPGGYHVYNDLHTSWIDLKLGDWVRIDDPNDTYPIDAAYMAANYDQIEENTDANEKDN